MSTISRCVGQNLQIFIHNPLLRGPKILCYQLASETPILALKVLIHERIHVEPHHQRLHIRRNFRNFQVDMRAHKYFRIPETVFPVITSVLSFVFVM